MEQTGNYQLNLWEGEDRILREDFNADNVKTEAALAEQAEVQSQMAQALAGCGNCRIEYGSYTGNGKHGSGNKNMLTFEHKPILVFVVPVSNSSSDCRLRFVRGVTAVSGAEVSYYDNNVSWTEKGVQWYATKDSGCQFNASGTTYLYVAFLATDE